MKFCDVITTVVSDRAETVPTLLFLVTTERSIYQLKVLPLSLRTFYPFLPLICTSIFCKETSIFYVYLEFSKKLLVRRVCDSLSLTEGSAELDTHEAEPWRDRVT